jgi:hypothetical protein
MLFSASYFRSSEGDVMALLQNIWQSPLTIRKPRSDIIQNFYDDIIGESWDGMVHMKR